MIKTLFVLLCSCAACCAQCPAPAQDSSSSPQHAADPVGAILQQLNKAAKDLKTYQAAVEYLVRQPEYDTRKLRKGVLFYAKDANSSSLRVNFETVQVDDEPEQKQLEQYIFDGVWLTEIKYQLNQARRLQQAEPNKPADAFDLLSSRFPVIGFTKVDDLRKDFDIALGDVPADQKEKLVLLRLKVKPDSKYSEDYTAMDFWIDAKLFLPARITAVAAVEDEFIKPDIHEISFVNPRPNQPLPARVFDFRIPNGFTTETRPLQKD